MSSGPIGRPRPGQPGEPSFFSLDPTSLPESGVPRSELLHLMPFHECGCPSSLPSSLPSQDLYLNKAHLLAHLLPLTQLNIQPSPSLGPELLSLK